MAIINDLPVMSTPASGDELPIERGTTVYKIDYDALAAEILAQCATGVKGNAESTYRKGNVNLTPANIGAAAASDMGALSSLNTTVKTSIVAAINEIVSNGASWDYYSNTVNGLTIGLWASKIIPRLIKLKITGSATSDMETSAGYYSLWTPTYFTNIGNAAHISYEQLTATIIGQLYIEGSGVIKIGYTRNLSTSAATNITAGTNFYWQKTMMLNS